jgi:hypothetical protein
MTVPVRFADYHTVVARKIVLKFPGSDRGDNCIRQEPTLATIVIIM